MFRLLLALVIVGALSYWALRPRHNQNIMARQIGLMEKTLSDNGCGSGTAPGRSPAVAGDARLEMRNLQQQIEKCEARAVSPDAAERGAVDAPAPTGT